MSAQDQTILFGQQKAINNLSSDAGLSNNNLDSYLKKRYNRPLYQLTQSEGVEIIKGFQDGTISKNSVLEYIKNSIFLKYNFLLDLSYFLKSQIFLPLLIHFLILEEVLHFYLMHF